MPYTATMSYMLRAERSSSPPAAKVWKRSRSISPEATSRSTPAMMGSMPTAAAPEWGSAAWEAVRFPENQKHSTAKKQTGYRICLTPGMGKCLPCPAKCPPCSSGIRPKYPEKRHRRQPEVLPIRKRPISGSAAAPSRSSMRPAVTQTGLIPTEASIWMAGRS